jgi:hypothetical protein
MLSYRMRAILLRSTIFFCLFAFTPTAFAGQARPTAQKVRQATILSTPGIDPYYIYQQLEYMATHFLKREAGYDTNLPPEQNGHDEFANYWTEQMLTLLGPFGAEVRNDQFPIQGWMGRPAPVPAANVELTVPGILYPEQEVVIGCHYDGEADSSQSANDDASGCAIELGVARAMSEFWQANHVYPARTLRFVIYDAEEQGLYGSFHYVNSTVNGDLKNIVAMFNEEQSGIAYPLRYLGDMSSPLMPLYIYMSPLQNGGFYPQQDQLTTQQRANIVQFRQLMQQAVVASFKQFRAMGDQMLTYHNGQGKDVWQPIFIQDQLSFIHQGDDTLGGSDQIPFTLAGLPCATFAGNSTYYNPGAPPGSYPFDQPDDTIQLMNTFADGNSEQSQALTLALALPGMLTTWMLSQSSILGQAPADNKPIAAISSIGLAQPGQAMYFDGGAAFDPTKANSPLSYHWNFGDGHQADGQKVNHTYAAPGNYTLSLIISSASGTRVITKQLSIGQPASYDNPYSSYGSDGIPPANPDVTLPKPIPGLSDKVGTVTDSKQQTSGSAPSAQTSGPALLLWVGIGALIGLAAIGILAIRRKRV